MKYTRTKTSTAKPFDLEAVKAYARVDGDYDDATVNQLAMTAAAEIEASCDIALISQTITATVDALQVHTLDLPVGPVLQGASALVEVIAQDGSATAVATPYRITAERYPELHFTEAQSGQLQITYTAGYGATAAAVPADLGQAINDYALRMYGMRGDENAPVGISAAAARIIARYRRVRT